MRGASGYEVLGPVNAPFPYQFDLILLEMVIQITSNNQYLKTLRR